MNVLPLVTRELQVGLRRPWTLSIRKWAGAGTMIVTIWALMVWGDSSSAAGERLFRIFAALAGAGCLIIGVFLVSDSLSRERREGTLGFLFLTHLEAIDVVLGKLAASGIVPASLVLAMFPGLAICQLAGGVSLGEFWRVCLGLGLTLVFVLAAGLFVSSCCQSTQRAYTWTTVALILLNPLWVCWLGLDSSYSRLTLNLGFKLPVFWLVLAFFLSLVPVLLTRACLIVSRSWRDKETLEKTKIAPGLQHGSAPRILNKAPIVWLMLRRTVASKKLELAILAFVFLIFLGFVRWTFQPARQYGFLILLFALHLGCEIMILARTAYSFYHDRQDGSLELLLGTALGIEEVFSGFYKFLLRQTAPMLWLLTFLDLASVLCLAAAGNRSLLSVPIAMAAFLWLSVLGLGWLGVYRSLMTNHPISAMGSTFFRLSFFPLVVSLTFLFAPRTDIHKVMFFWTISTAFAAGFFALDARQALSIHGRQLLLRPYSEKPPHIENELSFINWDEDIEETPTAPRLDEAPA
jgi:hypothetical protein